jgi:hypothetical protein
MVGLNEELILQIMSAEVIISLADPVIENL